MYKVGFILNGNSGRRTRFDADLQQARQALKNIEFNVVETTQKGHAMSLASEFIKDGCTHLVAVGGDGTLHEVVNGIMKKGEDNIVLGVLPYGTANDFVKSVACPENLAETFEAISKDNTLNIDLGHLKYADGERYFINIADVGIGADVVTRVNRSSKIFGANFTFFSAIVRTFLTFKNLPIKCVANDWTYEGKINSLVMANGQYFGSGLCIAPQASLTNGKFSVVISGDISLKDYLLNLGKIRKGELLTHPQVEYKTATTLTISSNENCALEADGEYIGTSPFQISIMPKKVRLLVKV